MSILSRLPERVQDLPPLFGATRDGHLDLTFAVTRVEQLDGLLRICARADVPEGIAGFDLEIASHVGKGLSAGGSGALPGGVALLPGPRRSSDRLVNTLIRAWDRAPAPLPIQVAGPLALSALHLEGGEREIMTHATRLKITCEPEALMAEPEEAEGTVPSLRLTEAEQDRLTDLAYWEAFLILDLPNGRIHLDEKDVEYRQPMATVLATFLG